MEPAEQTPEHTGELVRGHGRLHIRTELMRESLVSRHLEQRLERRKFEEVELLPWARLVSLGGSSILDRGAAILPLLDEIVKSREDHAIILLAGGGARMRHTLKIGSDLGLPIGGLAQIIGAVEEQNSHILQALLASRGGISMCREHFVELPKYLLTGMLPILTSVPPYHFWEPPPSEGDLPENGSDLGAFLTGEVLGIQQVIFVKDQDGQYSRNPRHRDAELVHECAVSDLLPLPQDDLIIERAVLHAFGRARHIREIRIINGLEPGALTQALAGERVGTCIHKD